MQEPADIELLRRYADRNSEEAFAALVARHVNMVYCAALRKTGNAHAAEDVTQAVFIILARKARTLRRGTILSGWLYQTARLTAGTFLRGEIRRARREQDTYMHSLTNESEPETWLQIAPLLEEGIGGLGQQDRNAIVLRFFEGKSFQEIGSMLGASDNAAKKRVDRALDKLRRFFLRRGVASTTAVIAMALSANAVHAAPAGLVTTISASAVNGSGLAASTLALVKGTLNIMTWIKLKFALGAAAAVLLAGGALTVALSGGNTSSSGTRAPARPASSPERAGVSFTWVRGYAPDDQLAAKLADLKQTKWPQEIKLEVDRIKSRQQTNETVNATMINLKPFINAALTDSPSSPAGNSENNLAELPLGKHIYAGVPFNVQGCIQLMGTLMITEFGKSFPAAVKGIPIKRRCARLYILHAGNWVFQKSYGTQVAKLVLHYEDGSQREIALVAGDHVFDWWVPLFKTAVNPRAFQMAPGTERAWTGSTPLIRRAWPDEALVLYRSAFDNPQPDIAITSLDYVSTLTNIAPFLVGLTVD